MQMKLRLTKIVWRMSSPKSIQDGRQQFVCVFHPFSFLLVLNLHEKNLVASIPSDYAKKTSVLCR